MCLLVTFLLIRSSSDPTFVGIFVCSPLQLMSIKNGYPIRIPSIKTWCPFHKPSLERCTTFNYSKCIVFKYAKSQNRMFSRPFHSHKMHLLALIGLFTNRMTDFSTLSYPSTFEIPILLYT